MKKVSKNKALLIAAGVVGVAGSTFADMSAVETAVTTAITAAETSVGTILAAGVVITIAFWSYGKIKSAIRKN